MSEIEIAEISIKQLKDAYTSIVEAMNNLVDVEGADNEYKELDRIAETIDNLRIDFEVELDGLKEQEYNKEDEIWRELEDRAYQDYVYERSINND